MNTSKLLILMIAILGFNGFALQANAQTSTGLRVGSPWERELGYYNSAGRAMLDSAPESCGGKEKPTQDQALKDEDTDAGKCGVKGMIDAQWNEPAANAKLRTTAGAEAAMKANAIDAGAANGALLTGQFAYMAMATGVNMLAGSVNAPGKQMQAAKANLDSQATEMANALAEVEKQQAATAIDFCSSFLTNFSADGGNKWNRLRDSIFVPMAILLLLPGAILTQVKSIIAAGTPVLGEANPFEGIQRSIIAIFLIPGTYLVINYSIDLNNSITYSIADQYKQVFGSDMYRDAISFHIRAFPARQPAENRNALDQKTTAMGPLLHGTTAFARFEGLMIENKIEDPVAGIYLAPPDRADESLPIPAIAAKEMFNSTNATFMIAWNILCAFQMIYFYYLWFIGPITAALWVWPMKSLRNAFPSWCEGVITLGFWSLFWNTSILLMACFRGVDETGTLVITALNFLATSSVKYAFDFAGLAKAAGQEAANMAEKASKAAAKGGGGGGGGGSKGGHAGSSGHKGAQHGGQHHQPSGEQATPSGPRVEGDGAKPEVTGRALNDQLVALQPKEDNKFCTPTDDPNFKLGDARSVPEFSPPPIDGDDKAIRQLPGGSFTVGDGGTGGHMFTRSMVDGKPVLTVTDMDKNPVKGMDGNELGPISLSDLSEGQLRSLQFDPDAEGKPRGSLTVEQGTHGGQLYHASSHGHSELVSFSGGHLSGHSSAAVDSGMHAAMMGNKPVAELQPGLYFGSDGNGGGALYDIDHNQISFDSEGNATLEDGRTLNLAAGPDGSQMLSVNGGQDMYSLTAHGHNLSVNHGDATHNAHHNPINSLYMGRDATTGASISTLFNDNGLRTESSTTLGPDTQRAYYNPDTQALMGSSSTHDYPNGDSVASYFRDDGSLVGTNFYQMTDDGFKETVYDADGLAVSSQQTAYNDNGYSVTSASYIDGNVSSASISQFDNSGTFLSTNPLERSAFGDVSNTVGGVVPDGGVFGAPSTVTTHLPGQGDVSNYSWPKMEAGDAQKIMPVDIAGTQLQPPSKDFSQTDGAYAANLSGQGQTAEVAYSSPVTTTSVDIVPPAMLDSTPIAYQQAELNSTKNSLESVMAAQVGNLTAADTSFNFNQYQGPPTGGFAKVEAPDSQSFVTNAAPDVQKVLPVDIAGTQITDTNNAAYELSQNSRIEGAYAQPGQGQTAEVAYSSPVTTTSVDIVPPAVLDSTPLAYQQAELNSTKNSLESVMASQVGGSTAADTSFNFNQYQGPPTGAFAKVEAPDTQQFTATPDAQRVLPVDIAGTQITDNSATTAAYELSQNSRIEGAYAQPGQGQTAEVAYSSPVTTTSVDIVPPAVLDATPIAYQQAEVNATKGSLESVMANQVGALSASADPAQSAFVAREAAPAADQTFVSNSEYAADHTYVSPAAAHYAANQVDNSYNNPVVTSQVDVVPPAVVNDNDTVVNHGGMVASPQVQQGPEVRAAAPEYAKPRTESVAQIASAAALASNAQQQMIGDPKIEQRTTQVPPGAPKRGLGTIFSDITMGKKAIKPNPNAAKGDVPTAQDKTVVVGPAGAGQPTDSNKAGITPQDPTKLMGKMKNTVDAETTMQLSTNQSLEKQMLQAGAHIQPVPANTLSSVLGKTSATPPQKPSEYLTNALVDYHTVSALIRDGKTNEAALVSGNALANISRCTGTEPQLLPLVRAFVELFNQKGMIHQAKAFADKEKVFDEQAKNAAASASNSSDNIWGA